MKKTRRVVAICLAVLLVASFWFDLPKQLWAEELTQPIRVGLKIRTIDGETTLSSMSSVEFKGGVINAKTAPVIPGYEFIRAYIIDNLKPANANKLEITKAELRNVKEYNSDGSLVLDSNSQPQTSDRVFFNIKELNEQGNVVEEKVEHSYPYSKSEGVTNRIYFEYYPTASIVPISYVVENHGSLAYQGPDYAEFKNGHAIASFTVSVRRDYEPLVAIDASGTQNAQVEVLEDISSPDRTVLRYKLTVNEGKKVAVRLSARDKGTLTIRDVSGNSHDWNRGNGKNFQYRDTKVAIDSSQQNYRFGDTVNIKAYHDRVDENAFGNIMSLLGAVWFSSDKGASATVVGAPQPFGRFGPSVYPQEDPNLLGRPRYDGNRGYKYKAYPGIVSAFAQGEGWDPYWHAYGKDNHDQGFLKWYNSQIQQKVINQKNEITIEHGPLAGAKVSIQIMDAKPSNYQGNLLSWTYNNGEIVPGNQSGSYHNDWGGREGYFNSMRLAYNIKIENVPTSINVDTEWATTNLTKVGLYNNYGIEDVQVHASKINEADGSHNPQLKWLDAGGSAWIDGPALVKEGLSGGRPGIYEAADPKIKLRGNVKNGYGAPFFSDDTVSPIHGVEAWPQLKPNESQAPNYGFYGEFPIFAWGSSFTDGDNKHVRYGGMNVVGIQSRLLQTPLGFDLDGGSAPSGVEMPQRNTVVENPKDYGRYLLNVEGNPIIRVPLGKPVKQGHTFLHWKLDVENGEQITDTGYRLLPGQEVDIRTLHQINANGSEGAVLRISDKHGNRLIDTFTLQAVYSDDENTDGTQFAVRHILKKSATDTGKARAVYGFNSVIGASVNILAAEVDKADKDSIVPKKLEVINADGTKEIYERRLNDEAMKGYSSLLMKSRRTLDVEYILQSDVIPKVGEMENPDPDKYLEVSFLPSDHGEFKLVDGKDQVTAYFINKKANPLVQLGNKDIVKPQVSAKAGQETNYQKTDKWTYKVGGQTKFYDPTQDTTDHNQMTFGESGANFTADTVFTASFLPILQSVRQEDYVAGTTNGWNIVSTLPSDVTEEDLAGVTFYLTDDSGNRLGKDGMPVTSPSADQEYLTGTVDLASKTVKFTIPTEIPNTGNPTIKNLDGKNLKAISENSLGDQAVSNPMNVAYDGKVHVVYSTNASQFTDGDAGNNEQKSVAIDYGSTLSGSLPTIKESDEGTEPDNKYKLSSTNPYMNGNTAVDVNNDKQTERQVAIAVAYDTYSKVKFVVDSNKGSFENKSDSSLVYYALKGSNVNKAPLFDGGSLTVPTIQENDAKVYAADGFAKNGVKVADMDKETVTGPVQYDVRFLPKEVVLDPNGSKPNDFYEVVFKADATKGYWTLNQAQVQERKVWVLKTATKKLNELGVENPTAKPGYVFNRYSVADTTVIDKDFTGNDAVNAIFGDMPEIQTGDQDEELPGYDKRVVFNSGKYGTFAPNTQNVVHLRDDVSKSLNDIKGYAPTPVPNKYADNQTAGYEFTTWLKDGQPIKLAESTAAITESKTTLVADYIPVASAPAQATDADGNKTWNITAKLPEDLQESDYASYEVFLTEQNENNQPVIVKGSDGTPITGEITKDGVVFNIKPDDVAVLNGKTMKVRIEKGEYTTSSATDFTYVGTVKVQFVSQVRDFTNGDDKTGANAKLKTVNVVYGSSLQQGDLPTISDVADATTHAKYKIASYDYKTEKKLAKDALLGKEFTATSPDKVEQIMVNFDTYYRVRFLPKHSEQASLTGTTEYYVKETTDLDENETFDGNPITMPSATMAHDVFEFAYWSADNGTTKYESATEVPAITINDNTDIYLYVESENIIPDPEGTTPPFGYVEVIFDAKDGSFANNVKQKKFWVAKNKNIKASQLAVSEPNAPNGQVFDKWSPVPEETVIQNVNLTFNASYANGPEVIPGKDPRVTKPGYYTVVFDAGEHGKIKKDADFVFLVRIRNSVLTAGDLIKRFDAKANLEPESNYVHTSWVDAKDVVIKEASKLSELIQDENKPYTITAKYLPVATEVEQEEDGFNITAKLPNSLGDDERNGLGSYLVVQGDENGTPVTYYVSKDGTLTRDLDPQKAITGKIGEDNTITFEIPTGTQPNVIEKLNGKDLHVMVARGDDENTISTTGVTYDSMVEVVFEAKVSLTNGNDSKSPKKRVVKVMYGASVDKNELPTIITKDAEDNNRYEQTGYSTEDSEDFNPTAHQFVAKTNHVTVNNKTFHKVTFAIAESSNDYARYDDQVPVYYIEHGSNLGTNKIASISPVGNYHFLKWQANQGTEELDDAGVKAYPINQPVTFFYHVDQDDIIPAEDVESRPAGYVTVLFDAGEFGEAVNSNTVKYYVKKKAAKLTSDLVKPLISEYEEFKGTLWLDNETSKLMRGDKVIDHDMLFVATYLPYAKNLGQDGFKVTAELPDSWFNTSAAEQGSVIYYLTDENGNKLSSVDGSPIAVEDLSNTGGEVGHVWKTSGATNVVNKPEAEKPTEAKPATNTETSDKSAENKLVASEDNATTGNEAVNQPSENVAESNHAESDATESNANAQPATDENSADTSNSSVSNTENGTENEADTTNEVGAENVAGEVGAQPAENGSGVVASNESANSTEQPANSTEQPANSPETNNASTSAETNEKPAVNSNANTATTTETEAEATLVSEIVYSTSTPTPDAIIGKVVDGKVVFDIPSNLIRQFHGKLLKVRVERNSMGAVESTLSDSQLTYDSTVRIKFKTDINTFTNPSNAEVPNEREVTVLYGEPIADPSDLPILNTDGTDGLHKYKATDFAVVGPDGYTVIDPLNYEFVDPNVEVKILVDTYHKVSFEVPLEQQDKVAFKGDVPEYFVKEGTSLKDGEFFDEMKVALPEFDLLQPDVYYFSHWSIAGGEDKLTDEEVLAHKITEPTVFTLFTDLERGSVTVEFVDEDGKAIPDVERQVVFTDVAVGTEYSYEPITIDGYKYEKLADDSAPLKGKVVKGEQVIKLVYSKIAEPVPSRTENVVMPSQVQNIVNSIVPRTGEVAGATGLLTVLIALAGLAVVVRKKQTKR